jgi:hypothetical protein
LTEPDVKLVKTESASAMNIVLTSAGVISGALLFILGVRGLITIINQKGGIESFKQQLAGKQTAAVRT